MIALFVILLTGWTAETTCDLAPFSLSKGLEDTGWSLTGIPCASTIREPKNIPTRDVF
jgi:hypothetical protein